MTPKANLEPIEQRKAMLHAPAARRLPEQATPFTRSADRDRSAGATPPVDHDDDGDNLRAARGILMVTLLSVGFWMVVALIAR